jgi:chemotaxis protein methyltransferase CheR
MIALDKNDVLSFFKLLKDNLGIDLNADKEYLLVTRLTPLSRANNFSDLSAYLKALCTRPMSDLHVQAFEAMTTKETLFFRDAHPFEALKTIIFPKIIEAKQSSKQINIWSAASSTGQEAYSLSMLLFDEFPHLRNWNISILGTDISDFALNKAKSGVYTKLEVERGLSTKQINDHFVKQKDNTYVLNEVIKSKVSFQSLNLNSNWMGMPKFDLILMRNVLIYFNQETKMSILKKVYPLLSENEGCLMLGASESILENNPFKQINLPKVSYFTKPKILERV